MTDTAAADRPASIHSSASAMVDALGSPGSLDDRPESELATGFVPLDEQFEGGLSIGDLCVLGGPPGIGKTIAAMQMARHMAASGSRVLYCCYEHDLPTLFGRLVALEVGCIEAKHSSSDAARLRSAFKSIMNGRWILAGDGSSDRTLAEGLARVQAYGDRLELAQLSGSRPGLDAIRDLVDDSGEPFRAVFVDYLQKLGVSGGAQGIERWTVAIEALKDLALTRGCVVVAISAVDRKALNARRVTLEGFRGSEAIAHEADVAIVMNSKLRAVSKTHLAYNTKRYDEFANLVVFSIEKNRRGRAPVNLEFARDFANFRFDPEGRFVAEQLVDDLLVDQ